MPLPKRGLLILLFRAAVPIGPLVLLERHLRPTLRGCAQLYLTAAVLEGQEHFVLLEIVHVADRLAPEVAQVLADLLARFGASDRAGVGNTHRSTCHGRSPSAGWYDQVTCAAQQQSRHAPPEPVLERARG